jgi:hypothetical protein
VCFTTCPILLTFKFVTFVFTLVCSGFASPQLQIARRCHLFEGSMPLSTPAVPPATVAIDKTGGSSLPNRICYFLQFRARAPYSIHVPTHFGDSSWESTTKSMKKEDPSTSGSDLNKNNIIKTTLDHLSEADRKALEAYHKEVGQIFLSHYELTSHGIIQRDAVLINIHKSKVTPKVRSNPSLS